MKRTLVQLGLVAALASPLAAGPPHYTVEPLGNGVYCFQAYFYANVFIVTPEGVIATDPINPMVAGLYRRAIREVTDAPVRYVIYSHDHSDHIAGGAVFRDTARFVSHENAVERIRARRNPDIVPPDITFRDEYTLTLGGKHVRLLYLGENHSSSNVAIFLPEDRILMWVDMVFPGSVPFRDLPGTDVRKYLESLPRVLELDFDTLVYGHGPPGPKVWVEKYIGYFEDFIAALDRAMENKGASRFMASGVTLDARKALDVYIEKVAARAVAALRPRYGAWGGFDDWAPMNARALLFYLLMDV